MIHRPAKIQKCPTAYGPLKSCHALTDPPFNIPDTLHYHKILFVEGIDNLTIFGQYDRFPPQKVCVRITTRLSISYLCQTSRFISCLCHIVVCLLITWVVEGSTPIQRVVCNPTVLWVPRTDLEEREALHQGTMVLHTLFLPDTCM